MSPVHLKSWVHQLHVPSGHNMRVGMSHMVHDERFWPVVVALAVIGLFITIIVIAAIYGTDDPGFIPIYYY